MRLRHWAAVAPMCVSLYLSTNGLLWAIRPPDGSSRAAIPLDPPPAVPPAIQAAVSAITLPQQAALPLRGITAPGAQPADNSAWAAYFQSNPQVLNLTQAPELRVDYVRRITGQAGLHDRVYVHLVQTAAGFDVANTGVVFSYDPTASQLRLDSLYSSLYLGLAVSSAALPGDREARQQLALRTGIANAQMLQPKVRWVDAQWQALQEYALDGGLRGAVNQAGRAYVWDNRRYATYSGKVNGRGVLFNPVLTGDTLDTLSLSNLDVPTGAGSDVFTDAQGNFGFVTTATSPINVSLSGHWATIDDLAGSPLVVTILPGALSPLTLLFNSSANVEFSTSQVNAYYHEARVHDYIESRGVNPAGIDMPLPLHVNANVTCNSFYDAGNIYFFKKGNGCINSAYDTIVYHEYGHFVDDKIGGITDGALSEGWGDTLAMYLSGQSKVGEGFFTTPDSSIRDGVNNYVYVATDEVHMAGQAWMGFAWDLRSSLVALLGAAQGVSLAENLVLPVFWANSPNIPAAVREVALRDSPDGDPTHGPHFVQIKAAADHHGLGFIFAPPPVITWTSPADGATVQGVIPVQASATDASGGTIASLQAFVDGGLLATTTSSTLSVLWDTTTTTTSAHSIQIVVRMADGRSASSTRTVTVSNIPPPVAVYDPSLSTVSCRTVGAYCDSGSALVGRGAMQGGAEPHVPNTINNSCSDGNAGTFHVDESNDRIRVYTLDAQPFAAGKAVRVEATVWAALRPTMDSLDLYYSATVNPPSWVYLTSLSPAVSGSQVLSATYTLPDGALQAVRANFRFNGAPLSPCTTGSYDDHDDLVFAVQGTAAPAPTPPSNVQFSNATSNSLTLSWTASASAQVSGYRIDVSTDPQFGTFVTGYQNLDVGLTTSVPVANLTPAATYYGRVRTYQQSGSLSGYSGVATAQTLAPAPVPGLAAYSPSVGAPVCTSAGAVCDSGSLVTGRANISGGAEPNQPNTLLGSCPDGTSGTFHQDESIDRVKISSVDGQQFAAGKTVKVEAAVWSYSQADHLDFYYTASIATPNWIYIGTADSGGPGAQTLSATYTLPAGTLQAVRAHFRFNGSPGPCSNGHYDESDDLAFAVSGVTGPSVGPAAPAGVSFSNATTTSLNLSWSASTGAVAATGYRVDVATDSQFTSYVSGYQNRDAGNVLSILVTGLQAGVSYYGRVRAYDGAGDISPSSATATGATQSSSPPQQQGTGKAAYDATLQAPACTGANASCDSVDLLTGRGSIQGGPEAHQPNTIQNSCADGNVGSFHIDESLDRIQVSSVDGQPLQAGHQVTVQATVWSPRGFGSDSLDLYYAVNAASPNWVYLTTLKPGQSGAQVLSTVYTLPAGAVQAVRGRYRYLGSPAACGQGLYDDYDDLVFSVQPR